jgi:hypothetical protein
VQEDSVTVSCSVKIESGETVAIAGTVVVDPAVLEGLEGRPDRFL